MMVSWMFVCQFGPPGFEKVPHAMTCFTHGRIILVKYLAVVEDSTDIDDEFLTCFVSEILF